MACSRCREELRVPMHRSPIDIHRPCEAWPLWWELGHWIALCLAVAGINQRRFNWMRFRLGLTTACGCGGRIETLNKSGGWLRDRIDVLRAIYGLKVTLIETVPPSDVLDEALNEDAAPTF
jgi:hypothetical protein